MSTLLLDSYANDVVDQKVSLEKKITTLYMAEKFELTNTRVVECIFLRCLMNELAAFVWYYKRNIIKITALNDSFLHWFTNPQ